MATTKLTLKLLIDKKANRVLFAEASKDFVDFLFSLLSLPVGSVIKLLTTSEMVGCIGNLYSSVENLNDTYILQPNINRDLLLNPRVASSAPLNVPLLTQPNETAETTLYYRCSNTNNHGCNNNTLSNDPNATCPSCNSRMSTQMNYVPSTSYYRCNNTYNQGCNNYLSNDSNAICPSCTRRSMSEMNYVPSTTTAAASGGAKGYVKEVVTYMVMDDLNVMPMSTISSITLLSKFNVENVNLLQERVVDFGMDEGLELLKISLESNTALSEVFLKKKV